jgi:hypothetical protein
MKKLGSWISLIVLTAVLALPLGSSACGCGMAFSVDPQTKSWDYASGDTNAIISYVKGREQLVFARTLQAAQATDKILLVPVPAAQPSDVKIDVLTELPELSGTNLDEVAGNFLESLNQSALLTQVIPSIIWNSFVHDPVAPPTLGITPLMFGDAAGSPSSTPNVIVYQHLDKAGLSNEVLTAKSAVALKQYFQEKGLTVDPETIPVLDAYIGKDYAFVASWRAASTIAAPQFIDDFMTTQVAQSSSDTVGLSIDFSTKKIFYPLLPTSTFGQLQISEVIHVFGLHKPELPKALRSATIVDYEMADQDTIRLGNQTINRSPLTYTTVSINAPSSLLTDDLWFSGSVPVGISVAARFASLSENALGRIVSIFVWTSIVSMLAGWMAGIAVFNRTDRIAIKNYIKLGFWNVFSIVGFGISLMLYRGIPGSLEVVSLRQKTAFLVLFMIFMSVLSIVGSIVLDSLGGFHVTRHSGLLQWLFGL